jgi:site-specific recombinase XerC
MLFDYLVVGQILAINPAHAVRGPKHAVKRGETPVLSPAQTRQLLDSMDLSTVVGPRDRALIALVTYIFSSAARRAGGVRIENYFADSKRWRLRLNEKGGKVHEMPAHHNLEAYLDAYMHAADLFGAKGTPLFRSADWYGGAPPARRKGRHRRRYVLSYFPGDRAHEFPRQRRHARKRAGNGRPRQPAHDAALRSYRRRGHVG